MRLQKAEKYFEIDITEERIQKAVDKVKHNKAAGEDSLVSTYVKGSLKGVKRPLINIFRRSLEETVIPQEWKRANVTAIFKKEQNGIQRIIDP